MAGNQIQAFKVTDEGRKLDLADRYLNCISSKFMFKINDVAGANAMMSLFSKEDENGRLNVHEMQTMWYEIHCGLAHYRLGEMRQALKNFQYIEKHIDCIQEDIYDFHHYSFRKGTINHYIEMLEFQDNLYKGQWPVKSCLNMLKVINRIQKEVKVNQGKVAEIKKEFEEYQTTDEYKKWEKEYENREDDDDVRNDPDPQGWKLYIDAASEPCKVALDFVTKVSMANPKDANLQVKALYFFIREGKDEMALKMAHNLITESPKHPKTERALKAFSEFAKAKKSEEFEKFLKSDFKKLQKISDADVK